MAEEKEKRDIEHVGDALQIAGKWDLECEVVLWALLAMKGDPTQSIESAMQQGLSEWDL